MAYIKTVWETGDVITAAKLNKIEDALEALPAPLVLYFDYDYVQQEWSCSETFSTIEAAMPCPVIVIAFGTDGDSMTFLQPGKFHKDIPEDQNPGYFEFYFPAEYQAGWTRDKLTLNADDTVTATNEPIVG